MTIMRKLLLGAAAISLSGCSFLGIGGHSSHTYGPSYGSYTNPAVGANACNTHPCLSRWNIEGGVGKTYSVGGTAFAGSNSTFPGAALNDIDMSDAYDSGDRAELGASYAMSPDMKLTGMAFYEAAESSGRQDLGTVGGQAISAEFSDYESKGVELGLRKYFNPTPAPIVGHVRPYVEGRVGATHINDVFLENTTVGLAPIGNVAFINSGWVGSAAGLVGIETPLTRFSTIGLETGIRYVGAAEENTSSIPPGSAFSGTNEEFSRTSIPIMLRGRYRF